MPWLIKPDLRWENWGSTSIALYYISLLSGLGKLGKHALLQRGFDDQQRAPWPELRLESTKLLNKAPKAHESENRAMCWEKLCDIETEFLTKYQVPVNGGLEGEGGMSNFELAAPSPPSEAKLPTHLAISSYWKAFPR